MSPQADSYPEQPARPLVAICIATYRRRELLRGCLLATGSLRRPPGHDLIIIVADNDNGAGARAVIGEVQAALGLPVHYCVEPQRGLASVRNRLIESALAMRAEWIAFLDDDECAEPDWLARHLAALYARKARVATGPVILIDAHGRVLHEGKRRESGSEPRFVACNNVVFSRLLVTEQGLRFDPRFNLVGGEDFDFFDRSRRLGNRHVWVADARVFETVPPERMTWRYLCERHFSGAASSVLQYRKEHGAPRAWCHYGLKAAGKLAGAGAALLAAAFARPRHNAREAVKRAANGIGYLCALLGLKVERYR